jgi:hypothetical protein
MKPCAKVIRHRRPCGSKAPPPDTSFQPCATDSQPEPPTNARAIRATRQRHSSPRPGPIEGGAVPRRLLTGVGYRAHIAALGRQPKQQQQQDRSAVVPDGIDGLKMSSQRPPRSPRSHSNARSPSCRVLSARPRRWASRSGIAAQYWGSTREGHPQAVVPMRAGCDPRTQRDGQPPLEGAKNLRIETSEARLSPSTGRWPLAA